MEVCLICKKKYDMKTQSKCILCNIKCCSINCLLKHTEKHSKQSKKYYTENNKETPIKTKLLNLTEKLPFITEGILQQKNKFDPNYSYKYLTFITENIEISSGSYGKVFLAKNNKNNEVCAVKTIDKKKIFKMHGNLEIIYNEIGIHSRLNHKNIIKLYNVYEDKKQIKIIMEYALNGNLYEKIKKEKIGFSEKKTFKYFIQVLNAINFLHKNNIIHRDIKPENILIDKYNNLKLCDFGWSKEINVGKRSTFCGTVEYMAPEIIDNENYDFSVDIWSLGILLYEMLFGYSPFRGTSLNDIVINIKEGNLIFDNRKNISFECKDLIKKLLIHNPEKRLKIKDVLYHPFILKNTEEEFYDFDLDIENELRDSDVKKIRKISNNDNSNKLRNIIFSGIKIKENKNKDNENYQNKSLIERSNNNISNKDLNHHFEDLIQNTPFSEQKEMKKGKKRKCVISINEMLSINKDEAIIPENKKGNVLIKQFNLFDTNSNINTNTNIIPTKKIPLNTTRNMTRNENKENHNYLNSEKLKRFVKTSQNVRLRYKQVKKEETSLFSSLINTFVKG